MAELQLRQDRQPATGNRQTADGRRQTADGRRQTAGWREVVAQQDCTGVGPGEPCTPLPPTTQWKTDAYSYQSGTHRLFGRSGRQRSYDNAGNPVLDLLMGVETIDPPPPGGGETESAAYAGTMQVMDDAGGGMEQAPPGAVARGYSYNAANRMSGIPRSSTMCGLWLSVCLDRFLNGHQTGTKHCTVIMN